MKERKVDEKKFFLEAKKCKFLSHGDILERPVAEGHDCKKHEDSANANDEDDHHDHCVAVALFHYSHNIKDKRAVACRGLDAGQSEEKKSLKNVARSGDIV